MRRRAKDDSAIMPRTGSGDELDFEDDLDDDEDDADLERGDAQDGDFDGFNEFVVELEEVQAQFSRMRSKSADSVLENLDRDDAFDDDNRTTASEQARQRKRRSSAASFRKSFMRSSWRRRGSSHGSSGNGLDPAFVADIRESLLEYSRIIKKRQGVGNGIYATPETTHDWGDKQKAHRVNWADLFMDLVFVATAFQEGKLLSDTLLTEKWIGLFYFYTTFAVLHDCWSLKLHFSSRFSSDDIAHKIFDIFEVLVVALMAGHLSTKVKYFEDGSNRQLFGFVVCKVIHQFFHLVRWLELHSYSDKVIVRRQSEAFAVELMVGSLPLIAALALAAMEFHAIYVTLCLFACNIFEIGLELVRVYSLGARRIETKYAVPMHIEYCTHRYGEWIMLMLGEGVMQIILVSFDEKVERYLTFIPAYLLMAALRILYYSSQPFKAQGHALHQSVRRGFIWLQLQPIESSLIVCVGIGLKELLELSDTIGTPETERYTWFFCVSISSLLVLVWLASFLHNGLQREFFHLEPRIRNLKLFTYTGNFSLSLALLIIVPFHFKSYIVVMSALVICALQVISHDLWHRISKENESDIRYMKSLHLVDVTRRPSMFGRKSGRRSRKSGAVNDHILTAEELRVPSAPPHEPVHHAASMPAVVRAHSRPQDGAEDAGAKAPKQGADAARYPPGAVAIMEKHRQRLEESFRHTFSFGSLHKTESAVPSELRVKTPAGRRQREGEAAAGEGPDATLELERNLLTNPELQADLLALMRRYPHADLQQGLRVLIQCNATAKEKKKKQKRDTKTKRKKGPSKRDLRRDPDLDDPEADPRLSASDL